MSQLTTKTEQPDLRAVLTGQAMKKRFEDVLPKHLSVERFVRVALAATSRNPKLLDCTQDSLMRCLIDLSSFGLEPDGRRAHLIPFNCKYKEGNQWRERLECTLIIDWKGLAELAMRSGIIAKLHADVVCENDVFDFNLGEIQCHKIDFKSPRGEPYAAYAMATTKDGQVFVQVMNKAEIEGIRNNSQGYKAAMKYDKDSPWTTAPGEMWKKTAFRRLAKWLPLSAEFRDAMERDADIPLEREVTPKRTAARATPLAPFPQPPAIEAPKETPDVEPEPVKESELFTETMFQIEQANTAHQLNCCRLMCDEIIDESERNAAKKAVADQCEALGLKWDGANFVTA